MTPLRRPNLGERRRAFDPLRSSPPERLAGVPVLQELDVSRIPCFGPGTPKLAPLEGLTLLYGPNGSGKSSIAAKLVEALNSDSRVLLFDQRYINDLMRADTSIEGVFTIRDSSKKTLRRLDEILGSDEGRGKNPGELLNLRASIDSKERTRKKKKDELANAESELSDKLWNERKGLPEDLQFAFEGTLGSRAELRDRTLHLRSSLGEDPEVRSRDSLVSDAQALAAPVQETTSFLPEVPEIPVVSEQTETLLRKPVTGKEETSFSEFVHRLGDRDWVAAGREPFSRAGGQCPFCQQEAPTDLGAQLDSLFDAHYEEQMDEVRALLEPEDRTLAALHRLRQAVEQASSENEEAILRALNALKRGVEIRITDIRTKIEHPSSEITLESLTDDRANLVALVEAANKDAERTMRLLADRSSARQSLKRDIWTYFVADVAASSLSKFDGATEGPQKAINSLDASLAKLYPERRRLEDEAKSLQEQMTSPRPTVKKINDLLQDLGFLSFQIEVREDETYRLVRPGGEEAQGTLSEGERTLISFLYFYFRALQQSSDRTDGAEVIVVLDDPVSSLDSESLFVISLLTRDLFSKQIGQGGSLSQVFLLTHNAYFYKEAAYTPKGQKEGTRSYLVLSKGDDGLSGFQHYPSNPIESTYGLLWAEVKKANQVPSGIASVALPNSMRRILENYFKVMGGVNVEKLLEKAPPDKNWAQWALLSWANDGSHSAPWDPSFAGVQITNKTLLKAFKRIFVDTGHKAHYDMMMQKAGKIAAPSSASLTSSAP